MEKACPKCGRPNDAANQICSACGWQLDKPVVQPPAAASPTPAPAAAGPTQAAAAGLAPAPAAGLSHSESDLWAGRASYKNLAGLWLLYFLAVVAVAALFMLIDSSKRPGFRRFLEVLAIIVIVPPALWLAVKTLYIRWAVGYRLTEQRLFVIRGILSRVTDQTELIRVDDVEVRQRFIQRLFGLGDVVLITSDVTDRELTIRGIEGPAAVAELIRNQTWKLRQARSLYVESV